MAQTKTSQRDCLVFIVRKETTCAECGDALGRGRFISLRDKTALCMGCADLDHLLFLPSGNAALTRRSRKASALSAVVLKWSSARKRYERQGLLVEEAAVDRAEKECLEDGEARERRRQREAERRAHVDGAFVQQFAKEVRRHYPSCPPGSETVIASHACMKHSGRIGRSAAAKAFEAEAIKLAVIAHIRHAHTDYDELLSRGTDRDAARAAIADEVLSVLEEWRRSV